MKADAAARHDITRSVSDELTQPRNAKAAKAAKKSCLYFAFFALAGPKLVEVFLSEGRTSAFDHDFL
jgi:hypothetical protein